MLIDTHPPTERIAMMLADGARRYRDTRYIGLLEVGSGGVVRLQRITDTTLQLSPLALVPLGSLNVATSTRLIDCVNCQTF